MNRSAHLGYDLSPKFWGHGLMGEAVELVLDYAFAMAGINRVQATTRLDNERSILVLQSAGFVQEGVLREFALSDGHYHDMRCFSILQREWLERRSRTDAAAPEFAAERSLDLAGEPG